MALMLASIKGHTDVVQLLLANNRVDVNILDTVGKNHINISHFLTGCFNMLEWKHGPDVKLIDGGHCDSEDAAG